MARFGKLLVCVYISKKTNWAMQLFNMHVTCFNMLQGEGSHFFCTIIAHVSTAGLWRVGLSSCHLVVKNDLFQAF